MSNELLPIELPPPGRSMAKVWSWLPQSEIESGALDQIVNLANLPSAKHVAVMPDAHKGYGMPIGTVLATIGTVVPYAVGVDIGCGMVAVKTSLNVTQAPRELVRKALEGIFARVPVGQPGRGRDRDAGSFKDRQDSVVLREWIESVGSILDGTKDLRERSDRQLGTLGGGNHFIELQSDGTNVWLMLHTGSRSFGKAICDRWYKYALGLNEKYYTPLPDKELAFLPLEGIHGGYAYLNEMRYAMRFAEESRKRIENRSIEAMVEAFGDFVIEQRIETHHNFAAVEKHMGKDLVVHRKGAVKTVEVEASAKPLVAGMRAEVTIPGSMQTGSYIGLGKPNVLALNTCSHGAGRRLGRKQAQRERAAEEAAFGVPYASMRDQMALQGIELVTPEGSDVVDEGGFAYKDIENVMRYQADLVEPVVRLTPLGVVKG